MKIPDWVKKSPALPGQPALEELSGDTAPAEPIETIEQAPDEKTPPESSAVPVDGFAEEKKDFDAVEDLEEQSESEPELEKKDEVEAQQEAEAPVEEDIEEVEDEHLDDEVEQEDHLPEDQIEEDTDAQEEDEEDFEQAHAEVTEISEETAQQLATEEIETEYEAPHQERPQAVDYPPSPILGETMFKITGDRIRLSINYVTAAVIVLIILTLLLVAFVIGKKTASPSGEGTSTEGVGELSQTQDKPPLPRADSVISQLPDGPAEAAPGKRDPKRYYLIIETLKGATGEDYDDAEEIIDFCAARGLPGEMVNINGRFAVWCLLGFRFRSSDAALEHTHKVEQVGKEFFAKKKTYRFMQRNRRGGELRPFFKRGAYRNK